MTEKRTHLHTRNIYCEGFQREDNLWDIEATLTDNKTINYTNFERGKITPQDFIHHIKLCVTVNIAMEIQDVVVEMRDTPFQLCKTISDNMKNLIGLKIGAGWMKEARERVKRTESCTHVMELLGPISTTAYQTMHFAIEEQAKKNKQRKEPAILDQCYSLRKDSPVVKVLWPEFHQKNTGKKLSRTVGGK